MNLRQIINEVLKDIDDTLTDSDIIGWINRALDDLTPVAKYQKLAIIPAGTIETVLPEDLHEIVMIDGENGPLSELDMQDKTSIGYKRWGNSLILQPAEQIYTLYYHARLPHLSNTDDVPVIRPDFHDLLVLYAVAKAKYKDEVLNMEQSTMEEYMDRKRQFAMEMNKASANGVSQVRLV